MQRSIVENPVALLKDDGSGGGEPCGGQRQLCPSALLRKESSSHMRSHPEGKTWPWSGKVGFPTVETLGHMLSM